MDFIYLHVGVIIISYPKETVGLADKSKNGHLVGKERRSNVCVPTSHVRRVTRNTSLYITVGVYYVKVGNPIYKSTMTHAI